MLLDKDLYCMLHALLASSDGPLLNMIDFTHFLTNSSDAIFRGKINDVLLASLWCPYLLLYNTFLVSGSL